jgi:hypothetical protein
MFFVKALPISPEMNVTISSFIPIGLRNEPKLNRGFQHLQCEYSLHSCCSSFKSVPRHALSSTNRWSSIDALESCDRRLIPDPNNGSFKASILESTCFIETIQRRRI